MTVVIGAPRGARYGAFMLPPPARHVLALMMHEHHALSACLSSTLLTPVQVLEVGRALLKVAENEEDALAALAPMLDPVVWRELHDQHTQLADDLSLLDWLLKATPDSPDVTMLAGSLISRMRAHVERDCRLLDQACRMSAVR